MLSKVYTSGVFGIEGFEVTVECSAWDRIPGFELVGLPDAAVKEAKNRVRSACENSGIKERLSWELTKMGQYQVDGLDLGHRYVTHGSIKQLHDHYGLSGERIAKFIMEGVQSEN